MKSLVLLNFFFLSVLYDFFKENFAALKTRPAGCQQEWIYSESWKRLTTGECCILLILLSQPLKKLKGCGSMLDLIVAQGWLFPCADLEGQGGKVGCSVHKAFFPSYWVKIQLIKNLIALIQSALWGMWLL